MSSAVKRLREGQICKPLHSRRHPFQQRSYTYSPAFCTRDTESEIEGDGSTAWTKPPPSRGGKQELYCFAVRPTLMLKAPVGQASIHLPQAMQSPARTISSLPATTSSSITGSARVEKMFYTQRETLTRFYGDGRGQTLFACHRRTYAAERKRAERNRIKGGKR